MAGGFIRKFAKSIFVLCNVTIAVLFLLGCYASSFNPETFWFFGLFTLASLYLLGVLLFFIVFWLFAKKKFMLISIIAIACAWKPLGHLIKFKTATDFALSKSPENIRIMSWNVEHFDILEHKTHPERKTEMIEMINKYMPDVACFQEMVGGDQDSTAINFVPRMAEQLNFKYYNYSYDRRGDFDNKHHFGIIIFSRFPIVHKETYTFDENNYNSIFQSINIVKDTDTFSVFNVHLQSLKFSDTNRLFMDDPSLRGEIDVEISKNILSKLKTGFLKRKLQSERVKNALNKSPYPVILCGDFNDVPNSYAYNTIGKGLKNAFTEKGSGIGRTFYGISPTLRIDDIFADERFEVEQFIRIKKKLSDHFPIITDLKLIALSNK